MTGNPARGTLGRLSLGPELRMPEKAEATWNVSLPRDVEVEYPDRCVACGCASPTETIKVSDVTRWGYLFLFPLLARKVVARAPACAQCRKAFRWSVELREVLVVVSVVGLMALVAFVSESFDILKSVQESIPKWIGKRILLVLAVVLGAPLWYLLCGRYTAPFGISVNSETVAYEFLDAAYACDFEELNQGKTSASAEPESDR